MPLSAIAGIASAGAGIYGGMSSARKASNFQRRAMLYQASAMKQMKADLKAGRKLSQSQYKQSLEELNSVGPAMRTELLAKGEQDIAGAEANALGTGLSGTTAMSGALRGARADTQRNLNTLEGSLASARSSLHSARGAQVYQEYVDKANVDQRTVYDPFLSGWDGKIDSGVQGWAGMAGAMDDLFSWFGGLGSSDSSPAYHTDTNEG